MISCHTESRHVMKIWIKFAVTEVAIDMFSGKKAVLEVLQTTVTWKVT